MAKQFAEQGGAATMNPGAIFRWLSSKVIKRLMSPERLVKQRSKTEKLRRRLGDKHIVEYFHQIDDGYSYLAAQALKRFSERYDIELRCHLVSGPQGKNSAEPDLLLALSRYDSGHLAAHYGLEFPAHGAAPEVALVELGSMILAAQDSQGFIDCAAEVGAALWAGDRPKLKALAKQYGCVLSGEIAAHVESGNTRRAVLRHYSGAMFYYGHEWYWGIDRLHYLEKRLAELGADTQTHQSLLMPRPEIPAANLVDNGSLTLEFYPSLRSPYTAIVFDKVVELANDTGVVLNVRPVLPMVMRGVPATREKGLYIFSDASREARECHIPFGNFYDPIGDPVRRCYSLYPWACEHGKGTALLSSFLGAAFAEGINTNNDKGLKKVIEKAGLSWDEAKTIIGQNSWEPLLEANRRAMYGAGLWGVPSLRLLNEKGEQLLGIWGQDRLWLVAQEIQHQLAARQQP